MWKNTLLKKIKEKRCIWIILLVICAFISIIPYIYLGEDSVVTYHDQLDGEIITYLLNAKHLFDGSVTYPELMNGISKNSMISPAPLFVFIFALFKPFTAFVICMLFIRIFSVISMFLLLDEITNENVLSFFISLFFMLLPFYTVYGLCIPGQPIIYYSFIRFKKEKCEWPLYFAIALFAGCSSLALTGFAVLTVAGIVFLISLIKKIHPLRYFIIGLELCIVYTSENLTLIKQLLGVSGGFVSHKSEIVHSGVGFFEALKSTILYGDVYTEGYQLYYIPIIVIALIAGLYLKLKKVDNDGFVKAYKNLLWLSLVTFLTALLSSFFDCNAWTDFTNSCTGIIREFNFGRFSWLLTVMWVMELALSLKVLSYAFAAGKEKAAYKILYTAVCIIGIFLPFVFSFKNNDLKPNLVKIVRHGDYEMLTWQQFFAKDLFTEVENLIGKEKDSYKIVSYGIYPAAASYNGFYCLDAYSNNYDVNYKHAFGEVIRPQLDKSEYLEKWFDEWGNRCYIVTCEKMNYFSFNKKWGDYVFEYGLNYEKLKEMGCEYIVSALYLVDFEDYGLTLLNKDEIPIESDKSWYRLFVYALN